MGIGRFTDHPTGLRAKARVQRPLKSGAFVFLAGARYPFGPTSPVPEPTTYWQV